MHALHACVALALGVLAVPRSAAADAGRLGVLAVAPPPGPGPELVEITLDLRGRLAEHHEGVLDGRALRERMTGAASGASLAELDRAFEGARAAWVSGDHEGSLRTLRAVVAELETLPGGDETFAQWTRGMLRLARFELNLGREETARATLERLVRAAPELEPDPAAHPPRFAGELLRARAALAALPTGALRVLASAPGARVFVDGREVGTAPVLLTLARGRHRVSGTLGALRVGPVPVEVGEGEEELLLDFSVVEALRPSAGPGLALAAADRARQIVRAGAYLRLERVLAVSLVEDGGAQHVAGALHDVRRGTVVREARVRLASGSVPVGGTSALAEFLVTGQARSSLVEVPGEAPPPSALAILAPPPSPREPLASALRGASPERPASRVLGFTAAGTGIVALGLAAYGALEMRAAGERYDEARARRQAMTSLTGDAQVAEYNRLVLAGDDAKRTALVSWSAAGASALAAGILGYVHYRRTGEIGPFRF